MKAFRKSGSPGRGRGKSGLKTYPRHLGPVRGKGYFEDQASGFLRRMSDAVDDVRQGVVGADHADFTPGFGTRHPQDMVQLGTLSDPSPVPGAISPDPNPKSKEDLAMSDQEIEASIREGRPPRVGH